MARLEFTLTPSLPPVRYRSCPPVQIGKFPCPEIGENTNTAMTQFWQNHAVWLVVLCVAAFVIGLVSLTVVLISLPADHFADPKAPASRRSLALTVIKNVLGILLLVAGNLLSLPLVPGPGLLVILLGFSLINFPGKHRLQRRLLQMPGVLNGVNALRHHFRRSPFVLPAREPECDTRGDACSRDHES
jgi:hypothetical protein